MLFGLKTVPHLFYRPIGTVIKHIANSYNNLVYSYMNDLMVVALTWEIAQEHTQMIISEISRVSLTINFENQI